MNRIQQAIHDFTNGQALTGEQIVHLLLLVTLVTATVHLITMLATRWGDRHIGAKSLAASILVHVVCLLGLTSSTAFDVSPRARADDDNSKRDEQVPVRRIIVESDREIKKEEHGNVPLLEKLADDESELARVERQAPEFQETTAPDRAAADAAPTDVPLRDIEDPVEAPQVASIPEDAGAEGPRQNASASLETDDSVVESRSDVTPNTPGRTARARAGNADREVVREVPRGSVGRIDNDFSDENTSPALRETESASFMATEKPRESISRTTGPVPADTEIDDPGADTDPGKIGASGAMSRAQIAALRARRARRTGRSADDTRMQREARTELPLADGFEVRESPAVNPLADSVNFTPATESADAAEMRRRPSLAATYRLRTIESRVAVARRNGGTEESERAVELSLRWLASIQTPQGSWDASAHGSGQMFEDSRMIETDSTGRKRTLTVKLSKDGDQPAGARADTGITALALLSFLGAGYTHEEGKYVNNVSRALRWLVRQQDEEGCLAGNATYFARNYCHAMATYALAEAMGMQSDPNADAELRLAVLKAVAYTSGQQSPQGGGWRYIAGQDGDMSMFGWQMMSLKSAEIAGVPISGTVKSRMMRFLRSRRLGESGGLSGYRGGDPANKTMTAESMFCRQMLGYERAGADNREAVAYLMRRLPDRADMNYYYWYYGTLSMFQYGGDEWDKWNQEIRELLTQEQETTGEFAGSWDPRKSRWGRAGGRVYTTALATLSLEVYYRFLPLYRAVAPPSEAD